MRILLRHHKSFGGMSPLINMGNVRARQEANRVFYSLVDEHARTLVTQAVFQAQHAVGEQSAHHGPAGPR